VESGHLWYQNQETPETELFQQLHQVGIFSRDEFVDALETCVNSSVESALQSANALARAIILFDRRLGRRRLQELRPSSATHPVFAQFYQLRVASDQPNQTRE
jgi:hypothetical protein